VGKIEQMAEGLGRFEQHLGLSHALVADARNVSRASDGEGYHASLADKVYSLYQADFETLGYDRDAWPAGQSESCGTAKKCTVPEEIFNDEIIERNLILSLLYQERDQLRADLRKVSRFRLLAVVNALLAFRKLGFKSLSSIKAWFHKKR